MGAGTGALAAVPEHPMSISLSRNFLIRVVTALAALPVVFGTLYAGGLWYLIFVLSGVALLVREWSHLTDIDSFPLALLSFVAVFAVIATLYLDATTNAFDDAAITTVLAAVSVGFMLLLVSLFLKPGSGKGLWSLVGVGYALIIAVPLLWLSFLSVTMVVWLLFVVWGTDVGGYFAGKGIGGPKLAPEISPKKTWAGAIGGVFLAVILSLVITYLADWWDPLLAAAMAVGLSIFAQVGDLYESVIKRRFDVKDSGGIIPGHGGLLDRIDGLAFGAGALGILMALTHVGV